MGGWAAAPPLPATAPRARVGPPRPRLTSPRPQCPGRSGGPCRRSRRCAGLRSTRCSTALGDGAVRRVGDLGGGGCPRSWGAPTFAAGRDARGEVRRLRPPAGQALPLLDAQEPSQPRHGGQPAGRELLPPGATAAPAWHCPSAVPGRAPGGGDGSGCISRGSLPGGEVEERAGLPGVSRVPHAGLAQGTRQHCPPCQDGAVEEGRALLARQEPGEGQWLPRARGVLGRGAVSHLLARRVVGGAHHPAQTCHVAAEDSDEDADAVEESCWEGDESCRSCDPPCSPPPAWHAEGAAPAVTHAEVGAVVGLHGLEEAALGEHRDVAPLQHIEGRDQVAEDLAGVAGPRDGDTQLLRCCGGSGSGAALGAPSSPKPPAGKAPEAAHPWPRSRPAAGAGAGRAARRGCSRPGRC